MNGTHKRTNFQAVENQRRERSARAITHNLRCVPSNKRPAHYDKHPHHFYMEVATFGA